MIKGGESMPTAMRLLYGLKNKQTKSASLTWNKFLRIAGNEIPESVMVTGNDLAMIEYTGGSTGVPKGVMLSNKNLNSYYVNSFGANCRTYTNYHIEPSHI